MNLIKLARYAMAGWVPFGPRHCSVCNHRVWQFMPYGRGSRGVPRLMNALEVIGSDVDHFECPRCGAHDRERHLLLYFKSAGLFRRLPCLDVLHFAPEKRLARVFRALSSKSYIRCDLYPAHDEIRKVDMLAMPFADHSFDLLIANHVLEHVADDAAALREIHRVLRPGGYAVLQTPYSRVLHRTWQDPGIVTEFARAQAYGQGDHVRLFGRDIFERFASSGLQSCVASHSDALGDTDFDVFGVNPEEPFFLFQKPLNESLAGRARTTSGA